MKCHSSRRDVLHLSSNHEEADTRMIIYALDAVEQYFKAIIVDSKDTDVFLLLIYFLGPCPVQTWMLSSTSRQRKCYPIHEIHNQLSEDILNWLLEFHAFTGCDSTSSLTQYWYKSSRYFSG